MSVLVNGSPAGFFPTYRGLRQGDPLSPLLFILVMEALRRLLSRAVQEGRLQGFAAVSGLRVNLAKSELIPVGEVATIPVLAAILGCKVANLPITYLGLPLGASFKAKGVWDRVVDRVQRRLAGWKRQYLSKGERLTLIKSVLSSIPTYFMSVHVIPVSVTKRIEQLQRDFLWGSGGRKGIWLGWEEFWKRVKLKVGVGDRVRFWRDRWCGDLTLEEWFPLVFGIAVDAEVLMGVVWSGQGVSTFWNVGLRRAVQDWEQGQLVELLAFLYGLRVGEDGQVSLVWECPGAKGTFSVSSYYRVLAHVEEVALPWKCVWVPGTPSKVAFFVWTAMLGRVLTLDNLIRRGHILVNWCCLCCGAAESVDHLLIHCLESSRLWMLVVATFGLGWVQPASVQAILYS
ncbi:uncharacterized protein LOC114280444 [Camellia sinensis]|uniref:uncharacterized protein LOC114280444 n=1 Tax=Camellia sinensis TaxID=4442 RepID=UPI001036305D|nr:uncharacterized protein LOC114280444 [Camellia sinensis]